MKTAFSKAASLAAAAAVLAGAIPFSASAAENTVYLTMNIPYSDFYAAEVTNNDAAIDAVSSATDAKWKKFPTTYYKENSDGVGGTIYGVAFPVAVSADDVKSLKAVSDEAADYYYTELSEEPAVYKELSVNPDGSYSFSDLRGAKNNIDVTEYSLSSETPWGDYLFEFADTEIINGDVYGIIATAADGTQYGMRHLENIWLKTYEFSWSSGFVTTEPHGNTLSPAHYESIMGKTIDTVTYITTSGVYVYNVDQYVPIKTGSTVEVEDAPVTAGSTTFSESPALPSDYKTAYSVKDLDTSVSNGTLSFSGASAGAYTLTVSDSSGKYAPITASFTLSTDKAAAVYDNAGKKLTAADDEASFKAFLNNISVVSVDGKAYSASGKRGTKIVNTEDGTIDLTVENRDGAIFDSAKDSFEMTVSAAGYPDVVFTLSTKEEVPVSSSVSSAKDSDTKASSSKVSSSTSSRTSSTASVNANSSRTSSTASVNANSSKTSSVTSPKTSGQSNALILMLAAMSALAAAALSMKKSGKE